MKSAVEKLVITDISGFVSCVGCRKESADIGTRRGCVRRIDEWVALEINEIATGIVL